MQSGKDARRIERMRRARELIPINAELLSLRQAAERGIDRLRIPKWAQPEEHLKIDIFDGIVGLWLHLFSPFNTECNGRDPVNILVTQVDLDVAEYVRYSGPLPDSDAYRKAIARFTGSLARAGER